MQHEDRNQLPHWLNENQNKSINNKDMSSVSIVSLGDEICAWCGLESLRNGACTSYYFAVVFETLGSFTFEDEDEDQVQLLLIVRMLKSVTVMA